MKLNLKYVCSIKKGEINIQENSINIKYGLNGIGKSSTTKALENLINKKNYDLRPYGQDVQPEIEMDKIPKDILVFNQEYVNNYLFKEDIVNNTFDILINTPDYNMSRAKINSMFVDLMNLISESSIKSIKSDINEFNKSVAFNTKKSGTSIKGTCKLAKGKKVPNISLTLSEDGKKYVDELSDERNYEWINWFNSGLEIVKRRHLIYCPLCKNILKDNLFDVAEEINSFVNSTVLKSNIEMKNTIGHLDKYLGTEQTENLLNLIKTNDDFTPEQINQIKEIFDLLNKEESKLNNLINLNVLKIKEMFESNALIQFFVENKLDLEIYSQLDKEKFEIIENINRLIDRLILKNHELNELTSEFAKYLTSLINGKEKYINDFLELAGIPYKVEINSVSESEYKTVLKPINEDKVVNDNSLSYGEKNALSLMLFSLQAQKFEMIVLDDPVSSFDNNKKYALLYYLFSRKEAIFRNKTVILFTHDFDIIIDFIYKHDLRELSKTFNYISNKNGILNETKISNRKIKHTVKQWLSKAKNTQNNKLIRTVNFRKYLEYVETKEQEAINIISSIEHRYPKAKKKYQQELIDLPQDEYQKGLKFIKIHLPDFDFEKYVSEIDNNDNLKIWYRQANSDIDKLQIMRIYLDKNPNIKKENAVFMGFITETYHVENNELKTLDEKDFNTIPYYIIKICDEIMNDF